MRSDLLRIISRWEHSGQGEGGMDEDDNDAVAGALLSCASSVSDDDSNHQQRHHGSLARRPAHALQTRAAFLNGRPSYLLYFWEIADCHQLLQSSLQRLSIGTGASDASCAVSTAPSRSIAHVANANAKMIQTRRRILIASSCSSVDSRTYSMPASTLERSE